MTSRDALGEESRHFSLDAWLARRAAQLPAAARSTFPFLFVPKASTKERNRGLEGLAKRRLAKSGGAKAALARGEGGYIQSGSYGLNKILEVANDHPTVKPVELGSWLVVLGSKEGDVVLDPYCGSGSFLLAAGLNGRRFVGVDVDPRAIEISRARLGDLVR